LPLATVFGGLHPDMRPPFVTWVEQGKATASELRVAAVGSGFTGPTDTNTP